MPTQRRDRQTFKKIFPAGFASLREMSDHPTALKLYTWIAEMCDHMNVLVCPVDLMAQEFGIHERTVRKNLKLLEASGHLAIIRIGTCNALVINPQEIWGNLDKYKGFCAFNSRTLAKKDATLKRRLSMMLRGQQHPPLETEDKDDG